MAREHPVSPTGNARASLRAAHAEARDSRGWRHPFDSAFWTIALGVLLTVVLGLALRLFEG